MKRITFSEFLQYMISHYVAYICAFIIGFVTFIPYEKIIIKGKSIDFDLLNDYADLAVFLSFPIGLLALILIYLTFYSQKKELSETTKTMKQQRFETTFFNLIELKNNSMNKMNIDILYPEGTYKNTVNGDEYIGHYYNELRTIYIRNAKSFTENSKDHAYDTLLETFSEFYNNSIPSALKQHLKLLYTFYHLKLDSGLSEFGTYSLILNSNMSKHESIMYYYYLLVFYGRPIMDQNEKLFWLRQNFLVNDLLSEYHLINLDLTKKPNH
jgi:hypothetical protein